jgi:hypothetical protein
MKSSPKNFLRIGSLRNGASGPPSDDRTTFEDEIFTTDGAELFTTGENPCSKTTCVRVSDATVYEACSPLLWTIGDVTPPIINAVASATIATQIGVSIRFCMISTPMMTF